VTRIEFILIDGDQIVELSCELILVPPARPYLSSFGLVACQINFERLSPSRCHRRPDMERSRLRPRIAQETSVIFKTRALKLNRTTLLTGGALIIHANK